LEESSLYYLEKNKPKEHPYKILFTGLDGAGKSSIILSLQREFSKIAIVEPTRGAQRRIFTLLGREISEWDLGGQKSYLISYLKSPGKYFDDTEIAIYVIDIMDTKRISESLSYLVDVIKKFEELKIHPPINIFLHKCDPVLFKRTQSIIEDQLNALEKQIKELANYDKIYFFRTSIYDPYSVMSAMSTILLELYPKSQLIRKTIEEFAKKLNCSGLIIIGQNSLILGSYFKDDHSKAYLKKIIGHFLILNDKFSEIKLEQQEDQIIVQKSHNYFLFKPIILNNDVVPHFMLILKEDNPFDLYFINKDLPAFINILRDILMKESI